jgi:hypothetical protein
MDFLERQPKGTFAEAHIKAMRRMLKSANSTGKGGEGKGGEGKGGKSKDKKDQEAQAAR